MQRAKNKKAGNPKVTRLCGNAAKNDVYSIGLTGIEPALPKELDPKSSASASSATAPWQPDSRPGRVSVQSVQAFDTKVEHRCTVASISSGVLRRGLQRQKYRSPDQLAPGSPPSAATVGTTQTFRLASTSLCR